MRFDLARARVDGLKRNRPHRPLHHFGKRDEDLTLDIHDTAGLTRHAIATGAFESSVQVTTV
jgi:hypothetical protein